MSETTGGEFISQLTLAMVISYNTVLHDYGILVTQLKTGRRLLIALLQATIDGSNDPAAMYAHIMSQPAHFAGDDPDAVIPQYILDALHV